jgi:predicted metal-dependent hydrolase
MDHDPQRDGDRPPTGDTPDSRTPDGRTPDEVRRFDRALALFEAGAWFTCHEVLEHLWLDETRPERDVYKGILQIAVGLLHAENGNHAGALRLLERGAGHLVPFQPARFGVDLAALRDEALRLRAALAALSPGQRLDTERWKELLPRVRRAG